MPKGIGYGKKKKKKKSKMKVNRSGKLVPVKPKKLPNKDPRGFRVKQIDNKLSDILDEYDQ